MVESPENKNHLTFALLLLFYRMTPLFSTRYRHCGVTMARVFLSYARRDLPNLQPLLQDLGAHGITVWRDQDNLYGGQH